MAEHSPNSAPPGTSTIRTLDFDANRTIRSVDSQRNLLDDDVDFMDEVAKEILERDRRRIRLEVVRTISFICAVLSWWVSLIVYRKLTLMSNLVYVPVQLHPFPCMAQDSLPI